MNDNLVYNYLCYFMTITMTVSDTSFVEVGSVERNFH